MVEKARTAFAICKESNCRVSQSCCHREENRRNHGHEASCPEEYARTQYLGLAGISMVTGRATTKGKAVRRQKERGIRHGMWRIFAVVKDTDITIASVDHFL